jgi:hypothetical protein
MKQTLFIVGMILLFASGQALAGKPENATQTGQSIMVNFDAQGTYALVQNITYRYN